MKIPNAKTSAPRRLSHGSHDRCTSELRPFQASLAKAGVGLLLALYSADLHELERTILSCEPSDSCAQVSSLKMALHIFYLMTQDATATQHLAFCGEVRSFTSRPQVPKTEIGRAQDSSSVHGAND